MGRGRRRVALPCRPMRGVFVTLGVLAAVAVAAPTVAADQILLAVRTKPQWFPDSKRVLYDAVVDEVSEGNRGFIATSTIGGAERVVYNDGIDASLAPDGTRMAVVALQFGSGAPTLVLLSSDGSGSRAIGPAGKVPPAWSPDGR